MSYVQYNRPFSAVGFRPYRKTTPFAAAHGLAGLGDSLPSNDTEVPGTGQTVGDLLAIGYSASDIMQLLNTAPSSYLDATPGASQPSPTVQAGVPNGSVLTYQAQVETTTHNSDPQDILRQVVGALSGFGLQVVQANEDTGAWGTLKAAAFIGGTVNLSITVRVTNAGFQYASDVQGIIDHQVYLVTGQMPIASGIGMQGTADGSLPGASAPNLTLSQWFQKNGLWLALGLVGVIVIGNKI